VVGATVIAMDERSDDESLWTVVQPDSQLTRRSVVASGATVLAGGTAALVLGTESAAADVTVDAVDVQSATFDAKSVQPVVDAEIAYEYTYDDAQELLFEVSVADTVVASETLRTDSGSLAETTTLSGRVTDSDAWTESDFDAPQGGSIEREVTVTVRFAVLVNGTVAAEDSATDSAMIEVRWPADAAYAEVGGVVTFSNAEE